MTSSHKNSSGIESAGDISLRDVVMPLFRKKRLAIMAFLSVFSAALLFAALTQPTYSSHMAILVNRERLDPLVSTEPTTQIVTSGVPVTEVEVNSELELLKSRDVLEKVVVANGLEKRRQGFSVRSLIHAERPRERRIEQAVAALAKSLKAKVATKTNLIDVTYISSDPEQSFGVLKSLGDMYTAKHMTVHRPAGSYEFFAHQTQKYHDQLEEAQRRLRDFTVESRVAAPDVQRSNLALQVANSIGIQHLAEQSIAAAEQRIQSDREQMKVIPQRSQTVQISAAADKVLADLSASLVEAQTRRTQLAMKYASGYPLVQEVDQEIANLNVAMAKAQGTRYVTESTDRDPTYELLREDIAKSQADLAAQRANLAATQRSIQSLQKQMVKLDQQAIEQQDLLREVKADESNYLLYLSKREQERTTDALDSTRIANVAIAIPPTIPVLPLYSWPSIIVTAFGLALFAGILAAYIADYTDPSFHTPAQVTDIFETPVVVTISRRTA